MRIFGVIAIAGVNKSCELQFYISFFSDNWNIAVPTALSKSSDTIDAYFERGWFDE